MADQTLPNSSKFHQPAIPTRPAVAKPAAFGKRDKPPMGRTTPAATGPTESVYIKLRITVERGKGYPSYRLFGSGAFVFFPVDLNPALKDLTKDIRPEDDVTINWRIRWYIDARGHRIITRVADATTGEVLAATDTQPALLDVTIDESTGQLTTEAPKSTSPFGRLGLPPETVEKARIKGEELRAERERKDTEMANKTSEVIADTDGASWTKTPGLISKFWETVFTEHGIFNKSEAPARALVVEKLGTDPDTWPTLDECYAIADKALEGLHQAKIDAQKPAAKTPEKAAETSPAATPIPETPLAPVSDAQSTPENGKVLEVVNPMQEAAFVVLFSLYGPHGAELKFTVRAMTVDELDARVDTLTRKFIDKGYKAERASTPAPATAVAPTPAPAPAPVAVAAPVATPASEGGTLNIQAIKKVMDEGKVRYELFTSVNDEKPALTVRLESVVKSLIAPHISVDALQPGTRYQVNWLVDWKNGKVNPNSGRAYRDVAAIRPAA